MIARLRQGNPGYDVAFANGYAIDILKREGLMETIDTSKIPNLKGVAAQWQGLSYDPNNEYTVPYLWGSMAVLYNTEKVKEPITSWEQVFQHEGPVAWINDSRAMIGVALHLLGKDNNTANPEDIAAAKQFLLENSQNVVTIANDDGQTLLERGEVDIAIEYSGDGYQLITSCNCDTYAYALPVEGINLDIAFMFVPQDAPNQALAEVFMDYIADPAVSAAIVTYTTYATPFQSAIDSGLIEAAILNNPAVFVTEDVMKVSFFAKDVGEAEQLYNDAWDEILIQVGQ
jgi:spermidine/putrescine transport system substrate-binding protein